MKKDTDKDEYIIKSLASIGKRKKWELYVVTRIIHLLKNNDLEFTCQQYVKQKDLDGYFFTDLFLGIHQVVLFTWGSIILIGLLSKYFISSFYTRMLGSFIGACLFLFNQFFTAESSYYEK